MKNVDDLNIYKSSPDVQKIIYYYDFYTSRVLMNTGSFFFIRVVLIEGLFILIPSAFHTYFNYPILLNILRNIDAEILLTLSTCFNIRFCLITLIVKVFH